MFFVRFENISQKRKEHFTYSYIYTHIYKASSRLLCFPLGLGFGALSCLIFNVSGSDDKSSDTLKALLSFPKNAQDLAEVFSLKAHEQVPPTPLETPSPPETPDPQAHHPGTAAPAASAARPEVSRKKV